MAIAPAAMIVLSLLASDETGAQSVADLRPETSGGSTDALALRLAHSLRLGTWGGSLEAGYQTDRQRTRSTTDREIDFARRRALERLTIRNSGFSVLDPRLFRGDLGLTFGLVQDRENDNGEKSSRRAKLTGYAFDSTILGAFPYSGTLFANRSQEFLTQPFGRTDMTFQSRGAAFRLAEDSPLRDWGFPYFSTSVRLEQQHIQEATTSALGQTFRRDELRNTLRHDAHKGYETADLDWRYEFNDFNNEILPHGSYRSHSANLSYNRDFGPDLNRRWNSRLSYITRSGSTPLSIFTADEGLRIEHRSNLATDYRYLFTRMETQTGTVVTQNGSLHVLHQLNRNLSTNALLSAVRQELPTGLRDTYAGQLDLNYRRTLPWNGTLFARVGGRGQLQDNRMAVSQISVVDEAHGAPSPLGAGAGFLLEQSFVMPSAVVVVDTRGGARLATTLGMDYDIVQEGNFTRIIPLATSAVIQAGDPLEISYTYEIDPSIKYSTTSESASAGVDFRWISFSYGHEQTEQKLISGQDSRFLQDIRKDSAQLDLRGNWEKIQAQAGAAFVHYDSTRLAYNQRRYYQSASYRPTRSLALGVNADWTVTDFAQPERLSDTRSARLTLDWYAPGGWSTTALLGRRVIKDSVVPTETVSEASLRARLDYGKIVLVSAVTASDRTRGGFQTGSWRLDLTMTRRF